MNKLLVIVIILMLTGCSNNKGILDENKINVEEVNKDELENEIEYNMLRNSFSSMRNIIQVEDGIMFSLQHKNEETCMQGSYFLYYENGESTLMNSVASNGCDFGSEDQCTSYYNSGFMEDFFYFNDKIYYIFVTHNNTNDSSETYLMRCDIDGTNKQNVVNLKIPEVGQRTTPGYSIHKGKLYVTVDNKLAIYNLIDGEIKIIEYDKSSNVTAIYLYDDIAYVNVKNYKDENEKRLNEALIKIDLNTYDQEVMYENIPMYFVDETNFISVDKHDDEVKTYLQNHETGEKVILTDSYVTYRLKENGKYILGHDDETGSFVRVFDEQGNLLKETLFEDGHTGMGVIDGKYYMRKSSTEDYYYLDLNSESDELVKLNFK